MALWLFKECDKTLLCLNVHEDGTVSSAFAGPDFQDEEPLRRALCLGIMEELVDYQLDFFDYKKYYINDFHFERVD